VGERSYTVMILPGSRARLWRMKLRRGVLIGAGALALVTVVAAGSLPFVGWSLLQRGQEISTLKAENDAFKESALEIAKLRDRIAQFESQANKFAMMAGVEKLPSDAGAGGATEPQQLSSELDDLDARSSVLSESFDLLDKVYMDQSLLLAATPSIAPVKGMISFGFGWRRDPFTGTRAFHKGIDVVAPRGTVIRAPADGIVTKASRLGSYGNVIYLSHGNGLTTRYAHLDGFSVKPGQEVRRGEPIGILGNTGRSLGAHLHYEILLNNTKVNPTQYILDEEVAL
jgi:murein DD-endopeptidase MepM/ murein hydrolase activator NlpD